MAFIISSTKKSTANTNARTVNTACRAFLICNASENTVIYFRENSDGVACAEGNGFPVFPKQTLPVTISAPTISIYAKSEADVFILYGAED